MRFFSIWIRPVLLGILLMPTPETAAHAATIRGRADCLVNGQRAPAVGSVITVFNARIGRSRRAPVGQDGRYYLYNVPAGSYALEVWSRNDPSRAPTVFQLTVYDPFTDVPVIVLPC